MKKTKDFAAVLRRKLEANPALKEAVEEQSLNAQIARQIYEARTAAQLTQAQLAERVGIRQSVIARLEDADYSGHSLSMLRKIANALGSRVDVQFYPKTTDPVDRTPC